MHVHGSNGVDVMATDEDGLRDLARFFATRGVTSFLPPVPPRRSAPRPWTHSGSSGAWASACRAARASWARTWRAPS